MHRKSERFPIPQQMCPRAKLLVFIKASTPSPCLQYCISVTSGWPSSFPSVFSHSLIFIIPLNIHFIIVLYSQIKSCIYLKKKMKRCLKSLSISIQQRQDRPPEAHSSLTGSCPSTHTNECHHIAPQSVCSVFLHEITTMFFIFHNQETKRGKLTSLLSYLSSFFILQDSGQVQCHLGLSYFY